MKISSITGELKPKSGFEYDYKIKFDVTTTKESTFNLITLPSVAFFKNPDGSWSNMINIKCPIRSNSFTVRLHWIEEKSDVALIVNDNSGEIPSKQININIVCNKCTLTTEPTEVKMGNDVICKSILPLRLPSGIDIKNDWYLNNDLMKLDGNPDFTNTDTISQKLKALKVGKTTVSTTLLVREYQKKSFYSELFKGKLEIEIKSPYSVIIDNGITFADLNSILTYRINGLLNSQSSKEIIRWSCNNLGKLISEQGKTPATFQIVSDGNYFEVSATITINDLELITYANKKVWIGKPTVNRNVKNEHSINAGAAMTLKTTEFAHYSGNIDYSVESGMQDKIEVERLTVDQFIIKSSHPKIFSDTITIKFLASNICGTVSNIHTVHIEADLGSGFDKPLPFATINQHSFYFNPRYKIEEYAGEIQNFRIYTTFTLNRKADLRYISVHINNNEYQSFKIYDDDKNELYSYTSSSETFLRIEEMKPGKYYLVVDVKNNPKDAYLTIEMEGEVKGSYPISPYIVDTNNEGFEFYDNRDTIFYNQSFYYKDILGNEIRTIGRNNIYYLMQLDQPMQLLLHTTGSEVCTEIHIMRGEPFDWKVLYHDEGNALNLEEVWHDLDLPQYVKDNIWAGQICIKRIFMPGKYRLVFNGIKKTNGGKDNGLLYVNILGRKVKGQSFNDVYELGHYKEREFKINQVYHDIKAHLQLGINRLYYHFSFEKNVDLSIAAISGTYHLPVELYDSQKAKLVSSESDTYTYRDILGDNLYICIDLLNIPNDDFTLSVQGNSRGRIPQNDYYNIGCYNENFSFSDSMDTSDSAFYELFRYKDENGNYPYIDSDSNHIYYKITLKCSMKLSINTDTLGKVSTEIHVMQGEPWDWKVLFHDMFKGEICLPSGIYYLVFNGVKMSHGGLRNGPINISVTGTVF